MLITALLLVACSSSSPEAAPVQGRILLWHFWSGEEAEAMDELLEKFMDIYPQVTVIQTAMPMGELGETFYTRAQMGLGPDLMIAPAQWEQRGVDAGLLQDLDEHDVDTSIYLPAAVDQLRYRGGLYALPLSVYTHVLFYNQELVSEPPATLNDLLDQAAEGKEVALPNDFYGAFWGVHAFGGQLFDEEGRVVLDQGGFADWLDWLKEAQNVPSIILSDDEEMLQTLFEEGRTAYYVGLSGFLPHLQEVLGEDVVGVAPLPAGPVNPSGPLLQSETLMFNAASSPAQTELALLLAEFLTNVEQQTKLARQIGRVPANSLVEVDPRVSPAVAAFVAQTKTAVFIPNVPQIFDVIYLGDETYKQALEGVVSASEAVEQLAERVNARYGFEGNESNED